MLAFSDGDAARSLFTKFVKCICTDQNINIDGIYFGNIYSKMTALMAAANIGLHNVVNTLLDLKANVNLEEKKL